MSAYVRIHNGAMTHPKVLALSDKGFRLWVWGLSYAQMHLTDGLIPFDSLPKKYAKSVQELLENHEYLGKKSLWNMTPYGYEIHDFLDWNDSKETVNLRQKKLRDRVSAWRMKRVTERVTETPSNAVSNALRNGYVTDPKVKVKVKEKVKNTIPTGNRPVFDGKCLTLWKWQTDKIYKLLGGQADLFDVDGWLEVADAKAYASKEIRKDWWSWLEQETIDEAARRGLSVGEKFEDWTKIGRYSK